MEVVTIETSESMSELFKACRVLERFKVWVVAEISPIVVAVQSFLLVLCYTVLSYDVTNSKVRNSYRHSMIPSVSIDWTKNCYENRNCYSFCLMVEASDHGYVLHTRRIHVTRYRKCKYAIQFSNE
jgi:hypothetical protein